MIEIIDFERTGEFITTSRRPWTGSLRQTALTPEIRRRLPSGKVEKVTPPAPKPADGGPFRKANTSITITPMPACVPTAGDGAMRIFPYGVNRNKLEAGHSRLGFARTGGRQYRGGERILLLKAPSSSAAPTARRHGRRQAGAGLALQHPVPDHGRLRELSASHSQPEQLALRKAQQAIEHVLMTQESVELGPGRTPISSIPSTSSLTSTS